MKLGFLAALFAVSYADLETLDSPSSSDSASTLSAPTGLVKSLGPIVTGDELSAMVDSPSFTMSAIEVNGQSVDTPSDER